MEGKMTYKECATDEDFATIFPVISQLRPSIPDVETLQKLVRAARESGGYKLMAVRTTEEEVSQPVAAVGYRFLDDITSGHFLYIDDLVVDQSHRRKQYGEEIMRQMYAIARNSDPPCVGVKLLSGHARVDAQRFYRRIGMTDAGLFFVQKIQDS
mmetsp:Transcript_25979/g.43455  ORF Transcript_25979/g.43455 Transcript_25979/m.43455 type:complete len:155 (+) Transcript_25979:55-519(+)